MEYNKENKCYKQKIDPDTGLGFWTFRPSGTNKAVENIGRHLVMFHENINARLEYDKLAELLQKDRKRARNKTIIDIPRSYELRNVAKIKQKTVVKRNGSMYYPFRRKII